MRFSGKTVIAGSGQGVIVAIPPLSFWGGYDPEAGSVIDRSHPAAGRSLAGTVLLMPNGRGSSSSSTVFAEAIRLGTAPAALVLVEVDPILVVGAEVAAALYNKTCPLIVLASRDWDALAALSSATVRAEAGEARIDAE